MFLNNLKFNLNSFFFLFCKFDICLFAEVGITRFIEFSRGLYDKEQSNDNIRQTIPPDLIAILQPYFRIIYSMRGLDTTAPNEAEAVAVPVANAWYFRNHFEIIIKAGIIKQLDPTPNKIPYVKYINSNCVTTDVMIKPIPLHKEPIKHVVVTLVTLQLLMTAKEDKLNIPEANDPTQAKDK